MKTLFGYKQTMTQTWDQQGKRLAVTKVHVPTTTITQVKTIEADGYASLQVGLGSRNKSGNKPMQAHLKKANLATKPRAIREIRLTEDSDKLVGSQISLSDIFSIGDLVSVSGLSKGRGFAGGVKRHGFKGGPRTHGQSDRERAPGSIGQGTTPGRVYPGKRMAGHYGQERFTISNLVVVHLDDAKGEVWISGPIPGSINSLVEIHHQGAKKKFEGLYYQPEVAKAETTPADEASTSTQDDVQSADDQSSTDDASATTQAESVPSESAEETAK